MRMPRLVASSILRLERAITVGNTPHHATAPGLTEASSCAQSGVYRSEVTRRLDRWIVFLDLNVEAAVDVEAV